MNNLVDPTQFSCAWGAGCSPLNMWMDMAVVRCQVGRLGERGIALLPVVWLLYCVGPDMCCQVKRSPMAVSAGRALKTIDWSHASRSGDLFHSVDVELVARL